MCYHEQNRSEMALVKGDEVYPSLEDCWGKSGVIDKMGRGFLKQSN